MNSLFLEDCEVGRVAVSCHLSMDLFVPRHEGCVQGELSLLVFGVPKKHSGGLVTAAEPFFLTADGL